MENLRLLCSKCNLSRKRFFTFEELSQFTAINENSQIFAASCGEFPPESESEIESESELRIREVIDYLNFKTGKRYDGKVAKNQEHISGRLNDGRTVEELKFVIDVKCEEWLENAEFKKNLNPVTLFRPSNFDRYINQDLKNTPVSVEKPKFQEVL